MNILVVEDNPRVLAAVGESLRDAGHLVTSTNNGGDAVCLLRSRPLDLLILDLNLPGVDGYEVLNSFGEAPPVILISGSVTDLEPLKAGKVARVLAKPFDQTQLLEAVSEVAVLRKLGE